MPHEIENDEFNDRIAAYLNNVIKSRLNENVYLEPVWMGEYVLYRKKSPKSVPTPIILSISEDGKSVSVVISNAYEYAVDSHDFSLADPEFEDKIIDRIIESYKSVRKFYFYSALIGFAAILMMAASIGLLLIKWF